jgi:hypothetical protein
MGITDNTSSDPRSCREWTMGMMWSLRVVTRCRPISPFLANTVNESVSDEETDSMGSSSVFFVQRPDVGKGHCWSADRNSYLRHDTFWSDVVSICWTNPEELCESICFFANRICRFRREVLVSNELMPIAGEGIRVSDASLANNPWQKRTEIISGIAKKSDWIEVVTLLTDPITSVEFVLFFQP